MTIYSHSRLSCFEQCPQKYKFQYVDRVKAESAETVEAFLGTRVHEVLEKLYRDLQYQKENSLDDLLNFLREEWHKNWNDDIIIVKKEYTDKNYLKMAEKYIADYYNRYYPFNQGRTIALEERILVDLDDFGEYRLHGYIDRLTEVEDGYYEIHDYKTYSRLPLREYIENDRQLALYMIGVKNNYPDVKDIHLVWHFLAFNKEVDSTRSDEELENLKKETIELIDKIENEENFEPKPSYLCEWCEYKSICRQWAHFYSLESKSVNEYLNDPGVKLVNKYAELKNKRKQLLTEIEKLEEALVKFAEHNNVDVIFGSNNKVRIVTSERFIFPSKHSEKRKHLEQLLKDAGKWDEVVQLDTSALNRILQDNLWDDKILKMLKDYVKLEKSRRLYLSKIKTEE